MSKPFYYIMDYKKVKNLSDELLQKPQLVLFKDEEEYDYTYGILFNNDILCFDCGGFIEIEEVIDIIIIPKGIKYLDMTLKENYATVNEIITELLEED